MKSMKKLVLVGLVLLASVMVLAGCKNDSVPEVPHEHSFAEQWTYDGTHHWKAATCGDTNEVSGYAEHTFVNEVCSICNYSRIPEGFVYIPEGSFQMGSEAGYDNNKPVHTVKISKGFYMGKYEVTQWEYLDVMGKWGGTEPSEQYGKGDKNPAYYVSWYDAVVYCNKRSIAEKLEPVYKKGDETDPDKWGDIPSNGNDEEWDNISFDWDANGYRLPKVAAIQRVPRRVLTVSSAVVVGTTTLTTRLFLTASTTPLTTASTILVFVWCVPVLNKTTCCVKEQEYPIVINDNGIQQVLRCKTCVT